MRVLCLFVCLDYVTVMSLVGTMVVGLEVVELITSNAQPTCLKCFILCYDIQALVVL